VRAFRFFLAEKEQGRQRAILACVEGLTVISGVSLELSKELSEQTNGRMVLEATVICIDNSEWMRNVDYAPTRFQAQADAVNLISGAKTQSNPENTVGVLTMAGKGVRVLVTPTSDLGKILSCMHGFEIGGEMDLQSGVQVAQLALKHRQNKHQRQRIVLFAGR
jgi:26S proteasome regulatory subunit N10